MQPDFLAQRSEIEERIQGESGRHLTMFYAKFHCELNHTEFYWCQSKGHAREKCDYSIEGLRQHVPEALAKVRNSNDLGLLQELPGENGSLSGGDCI
jgi:hypothetical protein